MKKMSKILIMLLAVLLILVTSCDREEKTDDGRLSLVALNFPCYDALRAVAGDRADVSMILFPGAESHGYEPTPEDVLKIQDSDLFLYTGGHSEDWVEGILHDKDRDVNGHKLIDIVPIVLEENIKEGMDHRHHDHDHDAETCTDPTHDHEHDAETCTDPAHGHEHRHEIDEHVWTSFTNEKAIIAFIADELTRLDPENEGHWRENADAYISEIEDIEREAHEIVASASRKEIIVGDRFPIYYWVTELGLDYYAAFPGCAGQTEPSAKTVAFLIDRMKEDGIPVVLHMELANTMLADLMADETDTYTLEFNSAHNVSKRDFDRGVTWTDLMRKNNEVIKEALQ